MLADLDETIRQLLIREVPLDPSEVDISFDIPDREWSGRLSRPTVNCFLYDIRENHQLRGTDWDMVAGNGHSSRRRAPLRFDATYQVSVWARAPEDEHRLLWRVLWVLARHETLPEELLQGALREQPVPILAQVAQPEQAPRNAADLWQVIDNRIRPSLTLVVTLALDLDQVVTSPLVFTRTLHLRDRQDGAANSSRRSSEAIQIGGRVRRRRDATRPLAGVVVQLQETGAEVTTDEEGRFVFPHAPRGRVTLVVQPPGQAAATRQVEVPSPNYDMEV